MIRLQARDAPDPGHRRSRPWPTSRRKVEKPIWPGLSRTGAVVLPNGWSLKPAGRQVKVGDFPVAIAEHPTEPVLAVLHAGYGEHEVVTLDASLGQGDRPGLVQGELQRPRPGRATATKLFVGGGFDDVIYRFDHAAGLLSNKFTFKYVEAAEDGPRVPAGLAVPSKDGSDALGRQRLRPHARRSSTRSGKLQDRADPIPDESYPYGLAWDEAAGKLYVSLWNKAEVAVVDSTKGDGRRPLGDSGAP